MGTCELRPAGSTTIREATQLEALVRAGRATAVAPHDPDFYVARPRALDEGGSVADLLAAERGDR